MINFNENEISVGSVGVIKSKNRIASSSSSHPRLDWISTVSIIFFDSSRIFDLKRSRIRLLEARKFVNHNLTEEPKPP